MVLEGYLEDVSEAVAMAIVDVVNLRSNKKHIGNRRGKVVSNAMCEKSSSTLALC